MLETFNYPYIHSEIVNSVKTGRDYENYFNAFGYDPQNLCGKMILDVGAGKSNFAQMATFCGAKVINLDPDYPTYFKDEKIDNLVTGFAQELPFKTKSFDEVIASHSLYWIFTGLDWALLEMTRVTKPDGKIKIHPVTLDINESLVQLPDFISVRPSARGNTLVIHKSRSIDDWKPTIKKVLSQVNINYSAIYAARSQNTKYRYSRV